MVALCPPLPALAAPEGSESLGEQVAAWQSWSLLIVRRYTLCAKKVDLWRAWHEQVVKERKQ